MFVSKPMRTDTPVSDIGAAIIIDNKNLDFEETVLDIAFEYALYISLK